MNLSTHILKKNECYTAGRKIKVKGLMLHSTGVNNPKLSRYIDDPSLGTPSSGHWNQPRPGGRQVCVHGFIGKDKEGDIRTIQTLPWDHRGWHSGGAANDTHIGVEICEAALTDAGYFAKVYKEAVELFAYLAKEFDLDETDIITHSEGHQKGIASNHADVMHWFPKHGKSMKTFRADVKKLLDGGKVDVKTEAPAKTSSKSINTLAQEVIDGKHGSGDARKKSLGSNYNAVQDRVNEILSGDSKPAAKPSKTIDQLAQEVIDGKHGSGDTRKKSLGSNYNAVQDRVNEILNGDSKPAAKKSSKSINQLAQEVIDGKHGSGDERKKSLGSKYEDVQDRVNEILNGSKKSSGKSIRQLAQEVIDGKHGSGDARKKSLGGNYAAVQKEVNRLMS